MSPCRDTTRRRYEIVRLSLPKNSLLKLNKSTAIILQKTAVVVLYLTPSFLFTNYPTAGGCPPSLHWAPSLVCQRTFKRRLFYRSYLGILEKCLRKHLISLIEEYLPLPFVANIASNLSPVPLHVALLSSPRICPVYPRSPLSPPPESMLRRDFCIDPKTVPGKHKSGCLLILSSLQKPISLPKTRRGGNWSTGGKCLPGKTERNKHLLPSSTLRETHLLLFPVFQRTSFPTPPNEPNQIKSFTFPALVPRVFVVRLECLF